MAKPDPTKEKGVMASINLDISSYLAFELKTKDLRDFTPGKSVEKNKMKVVQLKIQAKVCPPEGEEHEI